MTGAGRQAVRPYMHTLLAASCYAISGSPSKRKQRPDKCSGSRVCLGGKERERERDYCANACVAVAKCGSA